MIGISDGALIRLLKSPDIAVGKGEEKVGVRPKEEKRNGEEERKEMEGG